VVKSFKGWVGVFSLCLALTIPTAHAVAASDPVAKKDAGPTVVKVDGFRSAKYGMSEKDIRAAIKKDFGLSGDKITVFEDPTERTTSLIISVDDLLPESGTAAVAYIMGFKSKALFRVNVVWGYGVTDKLNAQQVTGLANSLRNYLMTQNYNPETLLTNRPIEGGGVVAFRGEDRDGHVTELTLTVATEPAADDKTKATVVGATLRLSYIDNPAAPDVFSINNGF
jgi:hypothetical protein